MLKIPSQDTVREIEKFATDALFNRYFENETSGTLRLRICACCDTFASIYAHSFLKIKCLLIFIPPFDGHLTKQDAISLCSQCLNKDGNSYLALATERVKCKSNHIMRHGQFVLSY